MLYRDIPQRSNTLACFLNNLSRNSIYVLGFMFGYLSNQINVLTYNIATESLESNYELDVNFALDCGNFAQMAYGLVCTDDKRVQDFKVRIPFYDEFQEQDLKNVKELLSVVAQGQDIELYTKQSGNKLIILPQIGRLIEREEISFDERGLARLTHLIHNTGHEQAQIDFDIKDEIFMLYKKQA